MDTALILVVEPDSALREVLSDLLEFWQMQVEAAATMSDAIALVESDRPAGVILNLWPAAGDPIAFLHYLKGRRDRADVPVIALSDGIDRAQVRCAREAGADAIVDVPFELADLETWLRRLVPSVGQLGSDGADRPVDSPSSFPGAIAGGAEYPLHPLALALFRNCARAHHQCELSRRLLAAVNRQCRISRRVRALARELRTSFRHNRDMLGASPA